MLNNSFTFLSFNLGANLLANFGVALTYETFITLGLILAVPLCAGKTTLNKPFGSQGPESFLRIQHCNVYCHIYCGLSCWENCDTFCCKKCYVQCKWDRVVHLKCLPRERTCTWHFTFRVIHYVVLCDIMQNNIALFTPNIYYINKSRKTDSVWYSEKRPRLQIYIVHFLVYSSISF